jgi:hypothetical protein
VPHRAPISSNNERRKGYAGRGARLVSSPEAGLTFANGDLTALPYFEKLTLTVRFDAIVRFHRTWLAAHQLAILYFGGLPDFTAASSGALLAVQHDDVWCTGRAALPHDVLAHALM